MAQQHQCDIQFTLLRTGDKASAYEPVAFEFPVIAPQTKVMEGQRRTSGQKEKFLNQLLGVCDHINGTSTSPIFLSVERAVQQVQSAKSRGRVYVQSDLEENVDREIRNALD